MASPSQRAPLSTVALKSRCPRCGKGGLFRGFLTVVDRCPECGLSFAGHDAGDGPAFFVMLPLCLLVAGAGLITEVLYRPPMWLQMIIWPAFTIAAVAASLRPVKALMIALQYRHRDVERLEE